ncbi:hypothetical protein [Metamycoplasma auris]|uniref:Uncharacterized protein n=1 Tax=Metamycoplasma auris TaxID=51363 RepID=A0A2W7G454_9BACT|nr:hypothetical protein [Metamycoplasma auris]PZV99874.1 hypothetical protein BCF89_1052 [Metamycoplasma auris]
MAKSTLERYYISETVPDENGKVSFNFKKANEKISGSFSDFNEALLEYIRIGEASENPTRVWFHQDGAYRGSVNVEKAYVIVDRIKGQSVANEEAIKYIEKENLVDKPAPKASKKKVVEEQIIIEEEKTCPLEEECKEECSECKMEGDDKCSCCKECKCCNGEENKEVVEVPAKPSKRESRVFWVFFTLLLLLTITNIVLIVLRITNKI